MPHRYAAGKRQFEQAFGLELVEMPHTLADGQWIARNPRARADDLMAAFEDDSIRGIVSSIGGEESVRIVPYLRPEVFRSHPKVFVGYSDTTVTHLACLSAGLATFYGPAVMAGFAENCGMLAYLAEGFRRAVFDPVPLGVLEPNRDGWTAQHLDWGDPANQQRKREQRPCEGWRFLQGRGVHTGHLIGGCLEVLEWLRGTTLWPTREMWSGALLFLETSEEGPLPRELARALRNYAFEGVLPNLAGILFGRPGGQIDPARFAEYDAALLQVVAEEQGLVDLPIVSGMDFGHTDPFLTLPYGARAAIDCEQRTVRVLEAATVPRPPQR